MAEYKDLIKERLDSFLESDDDRICIIRGDWGVGKTFFWKHFFGSDDSKMVSNQAWNKTVSQYNNYSYVSLFGISNSDELRSAVFNNSEPLEKIVSVWNGSFSLKKAVLLLIIVIPIILTFDFSFITYFLTIIVLLTLYWSDFLFYRNLWQDLWENKKEILKGRFWSLEHAGKTLSSINKIHILKNYLGDNTKFIENQYVRDMVICFDDIERMGDKISIETLMGYADELAQQKNCKIILILNENELIAPHDTSFSKYREKIADVELDIDFTEEQIYNIFKSHDEDAISYITKIVMELNFTNLRVLKKTSHQIGLLLEIDTSKQFQKEIILQSVMLSYIYYGQCENVSLDDARVFLNDEMSRYLKKLNDQELTETEEKLNALFENSKFSFRADQFTDIVSNFLIKGYLEKDKLKQVLVDGVKTKEIIEKKSHISQQIREGWDLYRNSYQDNLEEIIVIFRGILMNSENYHYMKANDFLAVLKSCRFFEGLKDDSNIFDYGYFIDKYFSTVEPQGLQPIISDEWAYQHTPEDQDIYDDFQLKLSEIQFSKLELHQILDQCVLEGGPSLVEKKYILSKDCDEYYQWIKQSEPDSLLRRKIMLIRDLSNGAGKNEINLALRKIAKESSLNKHRISKGFGINIDKA